VARSYDPVSSEDISEIFDSITERYQEPVPIGGRCESNVYYRVEDLSDEQCNRCAEYVAHRIINVGAPQEVDFFLRLPGGYSFFAERLCAIYSEMSGRKEEVHLEQYLESKFSNGYADRFRGKNAVLVTDVITTARSSLEAHTKATLRGVCVLCWATLIDRTFGPGPVPIVSALTGAPVRMLSAVG
jgi:hypothetical protein